MINFTIKRILNGVVMLVTVSALAFILLHLGAGNVARQILGVQASNADVLAKNAELGLNKPILEQFWLWAQNVLQGNLGAAWASPMPVAQDLATRLPITLTLVTWTTLLAAVISVLLGVTAAVRGGWVDRIVQFIGLIGFAIPGFLVAFFLVTTFAVKLHLFNAVGWIPFSQDPNGFFKSATLPIFALALSSIAALAQQIRGAVADALSADYVRTLRARGLSFNRVVYKHVLRNAGGPALSLLGVQFVGMMGGAVIVEQIFNIPGLGPYAVHATGSSDIPATMGIVVLTAVIVIIVNLVIDLLSAALNPKVRLS
jgi:peptide/nickel transport system permease protein